MREVRIGSLVAATMLAMLAYGCTTSGVIDVVDSSALRVSPSERAVTIDTTGCGFAADRMGSGVAVGDGLVLTVAHLVVRSDRLVVNEPAGGRVDAVVVAVDLELDLAVLRLPTNGLPAVESASSGAGASGLIVGGAASGTVPFQVNDVVRISIEEILGSERHSRLGYKLDAITTTGDSGAGAYDEDNRLIGIVFATSDEGETTWITSSAVAEEFLAAHKDARIPIVCDPATSRLAIP